MKKKQHKIKKLKTEISKLFVNSKFLLLLSFLLACIFWVAFATDSDEESVTMITDIPVTIQLSEQAEKEGLRVYRGGDTKVTVQIKGNRLTVGSISNNDIQVVAQNTNSVNVANSYALSLSAKKVGVKTDYEIISVSPSVINVTVDKERSKEFSIEKDIDTSQVTLPVKDNATYYLSQPVLSNDTVTVTGPEQEVKNISKVQVSDIITGQKKENITKNLKVHLLDSSGEPIENELLTVTPAKVDVTLQVLQQKEVKIVPSFANLPNGVNPEEIVKVEPATITVAGRDDIINALTQITLDPIDFSQLDPTTTQMTRNITLPTACINITGEQQAKLLFSLADYTSKVFTISDIQLKNVPSGHMAQVTTKSLSVSIAGPKDVISEISTDDITATVDLTSLADGFEGSQEMQVIISIPQLNDCWCFNSENTVNVSIKEKSLIT
ncbi:MAG: CdaR family protein [Acutalibacteraceae bacterium]|nr:CdaR family protein [Acutalibacteraceae bacterium]